jgi:hypothetical protein
LEKHWAIRLEAAEKEIAVLKAALVDASTAYGGAVARIAKLEGKMSGCEHAYTTVRERVTQVESSVAEVQAVSAAVSQEVRATRQVAPPAQPALKVAHASRSGVRDAGVPSASMAPTSVPVSSATKVLVASACPTVLTKQDAITHAVHAVCLVGAFATDSIQSAQLVAGGKDLLLQGQTARPTFAAAVQGASHPTPAQPGNGEVTAVRPKGHFMVEVVLASSQAASLVLRDAHKLAGVGGMERTFVRRALTLEQIKLKRRLAAAHGDALQAARAGGDTRVRYRDDLYPTVQRRGADGLWRTERVFRELPAPATPVGSSDGTGADKAAP